jgi:hypothetical protein
LISSIFEKKEFTKEKLIQLCIIAQRLFDNLQEKDKNINDLVQKAKDFLSQIKSNNDLENIKRKLMEQNNKKLGDLRKKSGGKNRTRHRRNLSNKVIHRRKFGGMSGDDEMNPETICPYCYEDYTPDHPRIILHTTDNGIEHYCCNNCLLAIIKVNPHRVLCPECRTNISEEGHIIPIRTAAIQTAAVRIQQPMVQDLFRHDQHIIFVFTLLILFTTYGLIVINQHMLNNFVLPIDPIIAHHTYGETYALPRTEWAINISLSENVDQYEDMNIFLFKLYAILICCIIYIINYYLIN